MVLEMKMIKFKAISISMEINSKKASLQVKVMTKRPNIVDQTLKFSSNV